MDVYFVLFGIVFILDIIMLIFFIKREKLTKNSKKIGIVVCVIILLLILIPFTCKKVIVKKIKCEIYAIDPLLSSSVRCKISYGKGNKDRTGTK